MGVDTVQIRDLSFGYTKQSLFSNLDLHLETGSVYGLLGKNGAGKTTLLKLLCGLRFPWAGECRVFDYSPSARPADLLADVYFLPEEFHLPPVSPAIYEALYAPFYPRFEAARLHEYMAEFELAPDKRLSEYSYGQKKKFLVAFGLASGCRLLLLDEPTNGMDIPSKGQFRRLLARSAEEARIILISTHQVRDLENLIDPVIILDQGRVIFQRSMEEVGRRLRMSLEREPQGEALYAEATLGGYVVVRENRDGDESRVDLEVLFNAVIANPERVRELFGTGEEG
jgi:ABC-2 type transport system ATP-binding protein